MPGKGEIVLNQPFAVPEQCEGCPGLLAINAQIEHYAELLEDKHSQPLKIPVHEDTLHMGALEHTATKLHQQASILANGCKGFKPNRSEACQSRTIIESRRPFDGPMLATPDRDGGKIRSIGQRILRRLVGKTGR